MVSISHRLRRSPSCFFACTLLQVWGCLLWLLTWLWFCQAFRWLHFLPCCTWGVENWQVHCQIQRAFRRGSFAADYLGATLCTVLCVCILKNVGNVAARQEAHALELPNPVGWGSRDHAPPKRQHVRDHTCEVQKSAGGPHYSMGMPCISYPILPFPGLHLLPWGCIPCLCYFQHH